MHSECELSLTANFAKCNLRLMHFVSGALEAQDG